MIFYAIIKKIVRKNNRKTRKRIGELTQFNKSTFCGEAKCKTSGLTVKQEKFCKTQATCSCQLKRRFKRRIGWLICPGDP